MRAATGLHLVQVGSGPTVIVLHGGLGLDHSYLRRWLDPLADVVRLVYVDLTGNGRSAAPADWASLDHAAWVADVERVREELGLERVALFGHSYGAYIALEHALAHPDRLSGLMLCEPAPVMDYGEERAANARAKATPEQLEVVVSAFNSPITTDPAEFGRIFDLILPLYFHGPVPAAVRADFAETRFSPRAFNRVYFECFPEYDVLDDLSGIQTPTLLLHGRHDWVTPVGPGGERMHRLLPRSELVVFENSGHFPFVEEPVRFESVVRRWIGERLVCERPEEPGGAWPAAGGGRT